jgi:hypothetical protein
MTAPSTSSVPLRPYPPFSRLHDNNDDIDGLPPHCLLSHLRLAAVVAAAAAAAAGVIDARSLIMTIEREGSKPSFGTLGQCNSAAQADGLRRACQGTPGGGSGGGVLVFACQQS